MSIGAKRMPGEGEVESWIQESREELIELISGEASGEEQVFQDWLERHPAFVPGARGPAGNSGHNPWPDALISQPRLPGINGKQPDFCWIASDSAEVTAMMIEIETPRKRWQRESEVVQSAELTQAVEQLNSWRAWFAEPHHQTAFLNEYLVPHHIANRHFSQEYILIYGSRSEFEGDRLRERQRAASIRGDDYQLMSFDRLVEIADGWSARFGCVHREGSGYRAVAVPPVFTPLGMTDTALALTTGYEETLATSGMDADRSERVAAELKERSEQSAQPPRFRPGRSITPDS